jgi:hypothetical protein
MTPFHTVADYVKLSRGWTLQELIAPIQLEFLDGSWSKRGSRRDHATILSEASGIHKDIFYPMRLNSIQDLLDDISVSTRMSWASKRNTTRVEDMAYCLLGLFRVHMPLLYGEGANAFRRLQEEIAKRTADLSLLAWNSEEEYAGVFAPTVQCFQDSELIYPLTGEFTVTNAGFKIESHTLVTVKKADDSRYLRYAVQLGSSFRVGRVYLEVLRISPRQYVRTRLITSFSTDSAPQELHLSTGYNLGREFRGVSLSLELNPTIATVSDHLRKMRRWIGFELLRDIRLVYVVPETNLELSNYTISPNSRSVMVLSVEVKNSSVMFVMFAINWSLINRIYVAEYWSPAAQYILNNVNNVTKEDLEQTWNLSAGVYDRSEDSNYGTNCHEIRVAQGVLTVTITGTDATRLGPLSRMGKVSISCFLKSDQVC